MKKIKENLDCEMYRAKYVHFFNSSRLYFHLKNKPGMFTIEYVDINTRKIYYSTKNSGIMVDSLKNFNKLSGDTKINVYPAKSFMELIQPWLNKYAYYDSLEKDRINNFNDMSNAELELYFKKADKNVAYVPYKVREEYDLLNYRASA